MKKVAVVIALLVVAVSFGQLNAEAETLKSKLPVRYDCIKNMAIEEWSNDHTMVVFEINRQSEAFMEFTQAIKGLKQGMAEYDIALKAMMEWSGETDCTSDWTMVLFEYERQVKAASQY